MQSIAASARTPHSATNSLLVLDNDQFRQHFDRHPFMIGHHLVGHPLLQLPRLIQLSRSMKDPILYFRGDHAINQVDEASTEKRTFLDRGLARPELSPQETLEQIESCRAWMQLRDVGQDPEYAALLAQIIDEFRLPSELVAAGLSSPRADIFVSSPGSTTPFHLDEEHNFLLQIRGSKKLSIADGFDPTVLHPERLTAYFRGSGELAPYAQSLEEQSVHIDLRPGEGVHIPPCHPHWVQNGNEVSISLGILWYSDVTATRRHLYRVNQWLERVGLHPAAPGESAVSDSVKAFPLMMKRRLRRWISR
jgi:Cupin-like domain